jgi:hypothetical protein
MIAKQCRLLDPLLLLIGVDHPSFQQIAFSVEKTGECGEQELNHSLLYFAAWMLSVTVGALS